MVTAGWEHTVLLRSDGSAVAVGRNEYGECDLLAVEEGTKYMQAAAGVRHTVLPPW